MLDFSVQTLLLGALLGVAAGYLLWGRSLSRRRVEIETLNSEITEERATYALAVAGNNVEISKKDHALAGHASSLAIKEQALGVKEKDLEGKDAEILRLRARLADLEPLEARVCELTLAVAAKEGEMASLRAAAAKYQAAYNELTQLNAEQDAKLARHVALIGDLTKQLSLHMARGSELEDSLAGKRAEIESHIFVIAEKENQLSALSAHLDASNAKAEELESMIARLKPLAARARELEAAHEQALGDRDSEIALLRAQLEALKIDHETVRTPAVPATASLRAFRASASAGATPGMVDYDETCVPETGLSSQADLQAPANHADPQPYPASILLSAKEAELRHLRETVDALFGPVEAEVIAPLAAQMHTGSHLEDWLQAERTARAQRLERFRLERETAPPLF